MTCSCCGARVTVPRTNFCARCLLTAAAGADTTVLDGAEEAPPCELLSIIGDSPRATTFLGEQTWPVRRLVAFKLFKDRARTVTASSDQGVPRHPNIAPLLEVGRLGERPYGMTEYFGGGVLTKCYDRHRLDATARLGALLAVADAIALAHGSGTVHGRLTAANLVCDSRPPFVVRIVDFDGIPSSDRRNGDFEVLTRADLNDIVTVAETLLQSPIVQVPASVDVAAELRRLRLSAQWAPDLRQALAALGGKLVSR